MATKKAATGTSSIKPEFAEEFKTVKSIALMKAIEIGESDFSTTDGAPIKPQRMGYVGTKAFEDYTESEDAAAQPGLNDCAFVPEGDGIVRIEHSLLLRNISNIKSTRDGGTLKNVTAEGMTAKVGANLVAAVRRRLNTMVKHAIKTGAANEISRRIAKNYFSGFWINPRNIHGVVTVTITRKSDSKVFTEWDDFAKELDAALFADYPNDQIPPTRSYIVRAEVQSSKGLPIYGSEAYIDKDKKPAGVSRVFVVNSDGALVLTPQRVTYAIRSYDDWTEKAAPDEFDAPLPVHPTGAGHRPPKKGALTLLMSADKVACGDEATADDHFVMANIIHGCLLSYNTKSSKKGKNTDEETGEISE